MQTSRRIEIWESALLLLVRMYQNVTLLMSNKKNTSVKQRSWLLATSRENVNTVFTCVDRSLLMELYLCPAK